MRFFSLFLLLALDIGSKMGAISQIAPIGYGTYPFGGIGIFSDFLGISFSLNFVVNTGAAFGVFPDYPNLLFALRIAIILGLISYLARAWSKISFKTPILLIITGAIGNVIDYALYGHVIDFLHFNFWGWSFPVFNFADAYITIGVMLILLLESFSKVQAKTDSSRASGI